MSRGKTVTNKAIPSLQRRGGCARKENGAKLHQLGADGVVRNGTTVSELTTPAAPLTSGGCARKENGAKLHQLGADGVVRNGTSVSGLTTPDAPLTRTPAAAFSGWRVHPSFARRGFSQVCGFQQSLWILALS